MPQHNRAKKGEFVSRVPQAALNEISLQMQEQRETIDSLKDAQDEFVKLARRVLGMNVYGNTENAAIRDMARDLLVRVSAIKV